MTIEDMEVQHQRWIQAGRYHAAEGRPHVTTWMCVQAYLWNKRDFEAAEFVRERVIEQIKREREAYLRKYPNPYSWHGMSETEVEGVRYRPRV